MLLITWRYIFISILLIILLNWLIIYPYVYPDIEINQSLILLILNMLNVFYSLNSYEKFININTKATEKLVVGWRFIYLALLFSIIINNTLILPIIKQTINNDIINYILINLGFSFGVRTIEKIKGIKL